MGVVTKSRIQLTVVMIITVLLLFCSKCRTFNRTSYLHFSRADDSLKEVELFAFPRSFTSTGNYSYNLSSFKYIRSSSKVKNGSFFASELPLDSLYLYYYSRLSTSRSRSLFFTDSLKISNEKLILKNVRITLILSYFNRANDTIGITSDKRLVFGDHYLSIVDSNHNRFIDSTISLLPLELRNNWLSASK